MPIPTKLLYLLTNERYVLSLKLGLSAVPLLMFMGATRIPESLFTDNITVSGIFLGFSMWVLSAQMPYSADKTEFKEESQERFKRYIRFYLKQQVASKDIPDEEKKQAASILKDEAAMNNLAETASSLFLSNFEKWILNLISGVFWLMIIVPFTLSIMLAMAGLLHEGLVSCVLAILSTYLMFFGIINSTWEIMRLKTRVNFTEES